jgi:hypothetical protein
MWFLVVWPKVLEMQKKAHRAPRQTGPESSTVIRKRREMAIASLRELQAGQLAGKLINREQALLVWTEALGRIRDRCLAVPERLAPQLAPITNPTEIRNRLRAEMEDLLSGLAENAL